MKGPRAFTCPLTEAPCIDTRCTRVNCVAAIEERIHQKRVEEEKERRLKTGAATGVLRSVGLVKKPRRDW